MEAQLSHFALFLFLEELSSFSKKSSKSFKFFSKYLCLMIHFIVYINKERVYAYIHQEICMKSKLFFAILYGNKTMGWSYETSMQKLMKSIIIFSC